MLQYDPYHLCDSEGDEFKKEAAVNLDRAFRVQTTVVLLDGIVRNDGGQHFSAEQLATFSRVGSLIHSMLRLPFDIKSEASAMELCSLLAQVRLFAVERLGDLKEKRRAMMTISFNVSNDVELKDFVSQLESPDGGQPMCVQSASILLIELVEHLILRSLRLYMRNKDRTEPMQDPTTRSDANIMEAANWEGGD